MQTLVYYCAGGPALCVFGYCTSKQCLVLGLCCLSSSLGAPGACLFYGPPLFCATREWRTEPVFAGAGCICASPWLPLLLSWSSLGAHPVTGYSWCPPGVGERTEGLVDGGGGRGWVFRERKSVSKQLASMQQDICIYMYIYRYIDRCKN